MGRVAGPRDMLPGAGDEVLVLAGFGGGLGAGGEEAGNGAGEVAVEPAGEVEGGDADAVHALGEVEL